MMVQQQTRGKRRPSFLDSSLRLDGITELLTLLSRESKYFSQLRMESRIKFKKSFLKYLRYCVKQEFLTTSKVPIKQISERYRGIAYVNGYYTFHHITEKGRLFLEMVS